MAKHEWNALWWISTALDPVTGLDLTDTAGATDHSKVVPVMVMVAAVVGHFTGNPFPLWHLIVMFSAAFGYGSWRTFLKSKAAQRTDTAHQLTQVTHTISERRDYQQGIDPA